MAEVTIASNKWRTPTDDFSPLCDNVLKVNNSLGLEGTPAKQNSFKICAPACEMCITPFPLIGDVAVPCSRVALEPYMVLPATPATLSIPSSFDCDLLTGSLLSLIDSSNWQTNKCFRVGQNLANIFAISQTKSVVLRGANGVYTSDWVPFGWHTFSSTWTCTEVGGQPHSFTWGGDGFMEFRVLLNFQIGATCGLSWSIEARKTADRNAFGTSPDFRPFGAGNCQGYYNQYGSMGIPGLSPSNQFSLANRTSFGTASQYVSGAAIFDGNAFDPFQLTLGAMGCNAHLLVSSYTRNVTVQQSPFFKITTVIAIDPPLPWCYILKITPRLTA